MGHHRCMTTAWIDTHCHLDAPEFDADRNAVRQEATVQGVGHCVIPAVERSNWETVRLLAHQHGDSYALGIHPLYTGRADDGDVALLQEMLAQHHADPCLVAIGEIGLDYFVPGLDPTRQERFYRAQLQLARRFDLPVILHVRRSADKLLKGLRDLPVRGGIAHAFNGSLQQAQAFIGLGFKLGFGGAMTYDRALQLRRLAAELPEEALVLETDAPDIPPHWLYTPAAQRAEGLPQGRNAPAELPRIAEVLAQLRGQPLAALAQATTANACAALPRLVPLLALRGIDGEIEE
jgi:TatD DNase family protein